MYLILMLCGFWVIASGQHTHVIVGQDANPHSHPWLLNLGPSGMNKQEPDICGASLISVPYLENESDIVLTAAHCIDPGSAPCHGKKHMFKNLIITASNHKLNEDDSDKKRVQEKSIDGECHVGYSNKLYTNDIALIKLEKPLKFTDTVKPIELPKKGDRVTPGTLCTVAGWGAVGFREDGSWIDPKVLQELNVTILTDSECDKRNKFGPKYRSEMMICETATSGIGHACIGDSGGALVCRKNNIPVQRGILSFLNEKCIKGGKAATAVMHTDVSAYIDWIEEQIAKLNRNRN
jgi:secreted trypsin-like serine protease